MWTWYELSTSLHSSDILRYHICKLKKENGIVRIVWFLSHRLIEHASEPCVTVATSLSMWTQYYLTRGYPWTTPTSTSSFVTSFQRYRTRLFFSVYLYSVHVLHGTNSTWYEVHDFYSFKQRRKEYVEILQQYFTNLIF